MQKRASRPSRRSKVPQKCRTEALPGAGPPFRSEVRGKTTGVAHPCRKREAGVACAIGSGHSFIPPSPSTERLFLREADGEGRHGWRPVGIATRRSVLTVPPGISNPPVSYLPGGIMMGFVIGSVNDIARAGMLDTGCGPSRRSRPARMSASSASLQT